MLLVLNPWSRCCPQLLFIHSHVGWGTGPPWSLRTPAGIPRGKIVGCADHGKGNIWRALSKRGVCTYFIAKSCSESAEILHADSFCVKGPSFIFSTCGETRLQWEVLVETSVACWETNHYFALSMADQLAQTLFNILRKHCITLAGVHALCCCSGQSPCNLFTNNSL